MKTCPICGGEVQYATKNVTHSYKKHTQIFKQSGEYCNSCGEGFLSPKDLKSTKEDIVNFHRKIDQLLSTKELKRIRKKINLKQKEASILFGGGIRSFSKYETAQITQSKPLDILLRLIDQEKISIDDIRQVAE